MFVHRSSAGIDTSTYDATKQYIASHSSGATAADFGLDDQGPALVTRLAQEDRQGIPPADLEAGRSTSDLAAGKPDFGILRSRIDDENFLGSTSDGGATDEGESEEADGE